MRAQKMGSVVYNKARGTYNFIWWVNGRRRSKLLGSILQLPTRAAAECAAEPIRKLLSKPLQIVPTVATLVEQYRTEKMPERPSTRRGYDTKNHIIPRWGDHAITDVKPRAVELWLRTLQLAPKSKVHIRGLLRIIWEYAMYSEAVPVERNPMELVKIKDSSRPVRRTRSLTVEQFQKLLESVGNDQCWRTMLLVAVSFGLRISEVLGLKWEDVDWFGKTISIERGVVKRIVGDVKSKGSARKMACAEELLEVLRCWKQYTHFPNSPDWIFASPYKLGRQPLCYTLVWETQSKAAQKAGIGHISSHTFRHTFRTWLDAVGTPVGVQQKLMRHSDIRTTMNLYGDAFTSDMQNAHEKVVRLALPRA